MLRSSGVLARRPHATLYLVSFVLCGLMVSFFGPAVPYLAETVGRQKGDFGLAFTLMSLGGIGGAIVFGRIYDRGGHSILATAAGLSAVSIAVIALAGSFGLVLGASLLLGFAGGGFDLGGNVFMVRAVRDNLAPWMNALHLCFALGGLLAPILIFGSEQLSSSLIIAAVFIGVAAIAVIAALRSLASPDPIPHHQADGRTLPALSTVAVVSLFFFFYVGLEVSCISWLASFVDDEGFGGDAAPAIVTTVFFAAFAVGRAGSVVLLHRIPTWTMLFSSAVVALVASVLMWVGHDSYPAVIVASALFGIGVAPQFATMIATSEAAFSLTSKVNSAFAATGSAAVMTIPFLIGQRLNSIGPIALPQALTVLAILTLIWTYAVRRTLARRAAPKADRHAHDLSHLSQ